jgi:tetratricopeptide (TPR) repeat protein
MSVSMSWAVLGAAPAQAQLISEEAARACNHATPEETVTSCSAVIDSGTVTGRPLATAYAERGWVRTLLRKLDAAEADLDQAIKIDPTYPDAYADRANFWNVSRKPDRAMADAEEALRLDGNLSIGHFVRGSAALNLGQYDRAIADYTETMKLRLGAVVDVPGLRGLAYQRKGDNVRAAIDYTHLLTITPNDPGTLLNRGDAYLEMNDMSSARAEYSEAIRLAPDNPGGWKGRGHVEFMTQDAKGALDDFSEAIKRAPRTPISISVAEGP